MDFAMVELLEREMDEKMAEIDYPIMESGDVSKVSWWLCLPITTIRVWD